MKKMTIRGCAVLLLLWLVPQSASAARLLVPVGEVIGLELQNDSVVVAAFDEKLGTSARNAGLRVGDRIVRVDGEAISSAEDVQAQLSRSDGTVELTVRRDSKQKTLRLTPAITDSGPRLGIYLKEGITGIGTVTWYDPESGNFGALGHGINEGSGSLLQMSQGNVYDATILSVKKGKAGTPGQLMGALSGTQVRGTLSKNTQRGVFGTVTGGFRGEALPVCASGEIRTGQATILSTVDNGAVQEYSVEILKIYPNRTESGRNMLLRVTDPELLEATGGIVQGMSGSPIIQNGKLIGAVTHVLVNDPTTGYGIFIENMLDAAA